MQAFHSVLEVRIVRAWAAPILVEQALQHITHLGCKSRRGPMHSSSSMRGDWDPAAAGHIPVAGLRHFGSRIAC